MVRLTVGMLLIVVLALPVTSSAAKHPTLRQQVKTLKQKLGHEQRLVKSLRAQLAAARTPLPIVAPTRTPAAIEPVWPAPPLPDPLPPEPAATPQTDRAVAVVTAEVAYTARVLEQNNINVPREELEARSIMSYVVGHISAPLYGYGIHPDWTAENALFAGSGICGNAALTFAELARRLGLPVRSVQFYYGLVGDNHIADEVLYDGAWHYFDPTFGALYVGSDGHVLSIAEARALPDPAAALHVNDTLLWLNVVQIAGITSLSQFSAETDAATRVDIGVAFDE